ncbi:unnamed protein product [Fraxinus pennsylvanica]|uniref:Uncharacterized protein n=1 Tax=Fraxinus pennsylvanica TaxID=56036 RepID=A0AAD2A6J5_9LAMI|nr:unnamed protein product [Fraxinus pennsylvanica]
MLSSSQDSQQKSFRIKHDDEKIFSRLLSKETSKSNPSFRVYYGDVSSAVPFVWETTPGTPKHTFSDNSIPPLTPPPSYYSNKNVNKSSSKHSRSKILYNLLKRMSFKKVVHVGSSPPSSSVSHSLSTLSFSTSSSLSSFSDPTTPSCGHRRRRFSSWGSSFDHDYDHHHEEVRGSSRSCFGFRRDTGGRTTKTAFLSLLGRGSG